MGRLADKFWSLAGVTRTAGIFALSYSVVISLQSNPESGDGASSVYSGGGGFTLIPLQWPACESRTTSLRQ